MIPMPVGTQIWVACGATDMREGYDGLAMLVQEVLKKSHMFVFRNGRIGSRFCGGTAPGYACTRTTCIHTTPPSASVEDFSTIRLEGGSSIDKTIPSATLLAWQVRCGNLV